MGLRGPAPDPQAIRRDRPSDQATWTDLPQRREGPVPPWPMGRQPAADSRRARLWRDLWTMPQATIWELQRRQYEVALHVETLARIESGPPDDAKDQTPTYLSLALRQQDSLGLSSGALNRLRWRIAATDAPQEATTTNDRRRPSAKERLAKVVEIEARRKAG